MIHCNDFKQWLGNSNGTASQMTGAARQHMQQCAQCRELYEKDQLLEGMLRQGMQMVEPPADLLDRARFSVDARSAQQTRPKPRAQWWKVAAPVFASVMVVLVFVLNPFSSDLQTIDDVVGQSIAFHRTTDAKLAFTSSDVTDPAQWFTRKLGYTVTLPDMGRHGLTWKGGRKCRLGNVDAAYLSCKSSGKRASLFLIDPRDVGFDLDADREYRVNDDGHAVTVWKEAGVVMALVI